MSSGGGIRGSRFAGAAKFVGSEWTHVGGTSAGAIAATALPPHPRSTFTLSLDGPLTVGVDGHPFLVPGSMFGTAPEELALPYGGATILERVGALVGSGGEGVHLAGDIVSGRPRTWLEALVSGTAAGLSAAASGPRIGVAS
jgi:hypothetical protein